MSSHSESIVKMPLSSIVKSKDNPRKNRNSVEFERLILSMHKAKGLIHPIIVRKTGKRNQYELVTGESRLDAAKILKWDYIDTVIRVMSNSEVHFARGHENIARSSMTEIEEAVWAMETLKRNYNNKSETANQLGWSIKKLDSRILLTHCINTVRDHLAQRTISISMAELLATLTDDIQDLAIRAIVSEKLTLSEAKARVKNLSRELSTACFDTKSCENCNNNTARYNDLFEVDFSVSKGLCTNRICWQDKTVAKIKEIKTEAEESYSKVAFSTKVPKNSIAIIATDGNNSVGVEQYRACGSCANFGVLIDSRQGREGGLIENVCFDTDCNKKKIKEHQKITTGAVEANSNPRTPTPTPVPKSEITAKEIKTSIKVYSYKLFTDIAAKEVFQQKITTKAVAIVALLESCPAYIPTTNISIDTDIKRYRGDKEKVFSFLVSLTYEELLSIENDIITYYLKGGNFESNENDSYRRLNKALLKHLDVEIADHWVMDEEYLKITTKPLVKQLLEESGFIESYEANTNKKFCSKTKKSMLDAVRLHDFDFSGFIPSEINTVLKEK